MPYIFTFIQKYGSFYIQQIGFAEGERIILIHISSLVPFWKE